MIYPKKPERLELITQTTLELQRLNLSTKWGRNFLEQHFSGKRSRHQLTDQELEDFLKMLKQMK